MRRIVIGPGRHALRSYLGVPLDRMPQVDRVAVLNEARASCPIHKPVDAGTLRQAIERAIDAARPCE